MKTKQEIVQDWLPRYTGNPLDHFGQYILLTNFHHYLEIFADSQKRVWEYDERFKKYLRKTRSMAIDMESATIFIVGFANEIPSGALLLVTDQPMISTGVKTMDSDKKLSDAYVSDHIKMGVNALKEIIYNGRSVKHLRFS